MADNPKASGHVDHFVGGRIRSRRLLIGMSQEKLAAALGLTFQQIQKYEKGTNRIGAGRLLQIARILGVTTEYFFEGAPGLEGDGGSSADGGGVRNLQQLFETKDGIALAQAYLAIPDPQIRRTVVELVAHLAAKPVSGS
jgi:transcriptional regulator with XRE-family HTH domain